MKRKTWFYLAALVLALVLVAAWAFSPRLIEVEVMPVTQGRFETTIEEDGKTRLSDRYVVSAPLAGRLSRIALREGDSVAANATLALLTPVLPALRDERTLRELQARVESAQDNVVRAGTRIERAKVSLEQAVNEARRSAQLAQQGFIAPTKLDSDRLSALGAQREVDAASAERSIATHDLEQARAAYGAVQLPVVKPTSERGFVVRSPIAGTVVRVLQTSEATVALGTPLMEVGDTKRLEIVAELLTSDAMTALPGSRVMIERWGGPLILEGRVRSVEPAAFTKVSALGVEEQRVRILIDITSAPAQWQALGDGFRVSVRIVTLSKDQVTQVPVSAVFPLPAEAGQGSVADAGGKPTTSQRFGVFVADDRRARRVAVQLGARNASMAWIQAGLQPGQSVIVYPPAALSDGQRIKVRTP
jgi:HlyD family secretion protein